MRTETGRTLQQLKRIAPAIVTPMLEWFMKRYFLGSNGSWNEAGWEMEGSWKEDGKQLASSWEAAGRQLGGS